MVKAAIQFLLGPTCTVLLFTAVFLPGAASSNSTSTAGTTAGSFATVAVAR